MRRSHLVLLALPLLAARLDATALAPFIDLQEPGLTTVTTGAGLRTWDRTSPVGLAVEVGGSVRFALLYWAGSERPCTFDGTTCTFAQPYLDQQMVFAGTPITGTVIGTETWPVAGGDAGLSIGYFADVTSLVSTAGTGSHNFTFADGNGASDLSELDGVGLVVAYTDATDSTFYRVIVWDNLDFLDGGALTPGENREASPVIVNHGANPAERSGQLTLFVGDGDAKSDRVTISGNPELADSLDGSAGDAWDEPGPLAITIPADVGTTTVEVISDPGVVLHTVSPCRVVDTRSGAPLAPGETRELTLAGTCGIPADASEVAVNVTAVGPGGDGEVQVYAADGAGQPAVAGITLAVSDGVNRAHHGVVRLGADTAGAVTVHNTLAGEVDVVVDVTGYFTARGDDLLWIAALLRVPVPSPP